MTVDLFTLAAQLINFLILLLVLRWVLFAPISRVMAEREARIAAEHDQAETARAAAEQEAQRLQRERMALVQRRQAELDAVEAEVAAQRETWLEQARREVDEARRQWRVALHDERHETLRELRRALGRLVHTSVTRALTDLADAELDTRMARVFAARLAELDPVEAEAFVEALGDDRKALLRSATPLAAAERERLETAVRAALPGEVELRFETRPELVAGVALIAPGRRLDGSLERWLDALERDFDEALQALIEIELPGPSEPAETS